MPDSFEALSVTGSERLEKIAAALKNGEVSPSPTVREFLGWFGSMRRGEWVVRGIRSSLDAAGLRPVISGSGGLRKVRWATAGAGKRGGLRVIYYWAPSDRIFYMLCVYTKSAQGDLTPAQTRQRSRVVREEFK